MIACLASFFGGIIGLIRPCWIKLSTRWQAGALLLFSLVPIAAAAEFYPTNDKADGSGATVTMLVFWAVVVFGIWPIIVYNRRLRAEWQAQHKIKSPVPPLQSAADIEQRRQADEAFLKKLGERKQVVPVRSAPVDLAKLAAAVRDVRVVPTAPKSRNARTSSTDVESADVSVRDHSSGWAGHISYVDAKGDSSQRLIVVKRIEGYGRAETVFAYCCERKASRRFLISGIKELYCAETGEVLNPKKHFDLLASEGAIGTTDKSLADLITILVFLARCDGEFHPLEMESIDGAIEQHMVYFGGDRKSSRKAAISARKLAPDNVDFMNAISRLNAHPRSALLAGIILDAAEDVVEADGSVTEDEQKWQGMVFAALEDMALAKAA